MLQLKKQSSRKEQRKRTESEENGILDTQQKKLL